MHIKKIYETLGIDPTDVLHRFGDNEMMLEKFLGKFLNDQTFSSLETALQNKNWEEVFRSAHTLKGISGNFDFKDLYTLAANIVEEYRANNFEPIPELFLKLKETYFKTINVLKSNLTN